MLNDEQVAEIEARANAASEGPWRWRRDYEMPDGDKHWELSNPEGDRHGKTIDASLVLLLDRDEWLHRPAETQANWEFIAHAREDVPALCQTLRAAWKGRDDALVRAAEDQDYDSEQRAALTKETAALREQSAHADVRIAELERRLRIPFGKFPCALCGGPHDFDTSVPSAVWNSVIRARNLPDYLCTTCIVREFVRAGESFTAQLWNGEFNGVNIEVIVNGQNAKDAAAVQEENNSLRNRLAQVTQERDRAKEDLRILTKGRFIQS